MFAALIEKLQRRQDLSATRPPQAMEEIMEGRAQPAQIAGLLDRPVDERRAAGRDRRAGADDARDGRRSCRASHAPVFDTCGTGGDRAHTFNVSTVAALVLAACGVRVAKHGNRSVSSQVRQRRPVRGARRADRRRAGRRRALPRRGRHRVLLCADVSPVDASRGTDAEGSRRAHRVQSARAADESCRRLASTGRRAAAGADGAGRALAGAPGIGARLGRARRRRPRRDLDDRVHEGVGMPRAARSTRSMCIRRTSDLPKAVPGAVARRRCRGQRRNCPARSWPASGARRATSSC